MRILSAIFLCLLGLSLAIQTQDIIQAQDVSAVKEIGPLTEKKGATM